MQLDIIIAACGTVLMLLYIHTRRRNHLLPPGPKPLPVIGNMLDFPTQKAWETYAQWGKKYGDVIHMRTMGKSFIILNTFNAACDLFEKKSSIYSDRPQIPMLDLMGFNNETVLQHPGLLWRAHRTLYKKQLDQNAVKAFKPRQTHASHKLLRSILDSPEDYRQHLRYMVASIVLDIAYGHDVSPKADPFVTLSERTVEAFSLATRPGAYLVNLIPSLRYMPECIPGAGFQRFARESREVFLKSMNLPFEDAKRRLAAGTARPSFVANALADLETNQETSESAIKSVAGAIYRAGTDTTVSSLNSFILAMVLYPEVQRMAQAELDNVIGRERLPDLDDRPQLPYVEAVVKEVLRWNPAVPTAIPHAVMQDDVYRGYFIPKGSTVIGNSWAMLHDPEVYVRPFTFDPRRFIPDDGGRIARDPAIGGSFGFGRRICAGRYLADSSLWIGIASLLAAFDISAAQDDNGNKVDVRYALDPPPGILIHPRPFPCVIRPRSTTTEALIRQTEHSCDRELQ